VTGTNLLRRLLAAIGAIVGLSTGASAEASGLTVEAQLDRLADLGVALRPGFTVDDLIAEWGRPGLESPPFKGLLIAMGGASTTPPYPPLSHDAWHFDTECIEGTGSYVQIVERLVEMTGGRFAATEVKDVVDNDTEIASLALTVDGERHEWNLDYTDDWVDPNVFVYLDEVMKRTTSGQRMIYLDLQGQDALILVGDKKRLRKLRAATSLDLVWMVE